MHTVVRWPIAVLSVLAPSAAPAGISTTTRALSYPFVNGSILVGFQPTPLEATASGRATVRGEAGRMRIHAHFWDLAPASRFGPEYLTYVLWAVSPSGRAINLGEVVAVRGKAHVEAMTNLPTFGLILSAEPYFAVTRISHAIVLENLPLRGLGTGGDVEARFERLGREAYAMDEPGPAGVDRGAPPYVSQARNALRISRLDQAEAFAPAPYHMAMAHLEHLDRLGEGRRLKTREAVLVARRAVQQAEEARILAVDQREAQARLRERELTDAALTRAEAAVQEAEAAKAKAAQEASNAQNAQQAASEAARKATEAQLALRRKLQERLSSLLQTRETAEGLQATLTDVAFRSGRSALSPQARQNLAKVAGILLAHPGLRIRLLGHTDGTGSKAFNELLSRRRAEAVQAFLVQQGLPASSLSAQGVNGANPIAPDDTPEGRSLNRRVDLIVAGEPIGL